MHGVLCSVSLARDALLPGLLLAEGHSLCDFVNPWALAPGLNSRAKSLTTQSEASGKGLK